MDNFYAKYSGVGGGGGVTSINTETGAITIAGGGATTVTTAGTNITISTPTENAISQLTGDVTAGPATGSQSVASRLVATTNSTLTTLSALSLPGSQVTGTVPAATVAGNITATSNNTLTTLSSLSLPYAQVTGTPSLSGFANTTLSNLGVTSLNADLIGSSANGQNLGSASIPMGTLNFNNLNMYATGLGGGLAASLSTQNEFAGTYTLFNTQNNTNGPTVRMKFITGNATNGNSGDIEFITGSVSGSGTQGSFVVDAGAVDINGNILLSTNGAASFLTPNNIGHIANGASEPILISTGSENTNNVSGVTTVSTGSVSSVFLFNVPSYTGGNISVGDTYSLSGTTYVFVQSVYNSFYFSSLGAGLPPTSGTLTPVSSATGGPVTFNSSSQTIATSANLYLTTGAGGNYANSGNVIISPGSVGTGGAKGDVQILGPKLDLTGTNVIQLASTVTPSGTDGAQTINKASGTVNFAPAATSLVVTNNLVTANSLVFATIRTNDATAVIKNVIPASGSFTINLNAAATAETSVGFFVINQ